MAGAAVNPGTVNSQQMNHLAGVAVRLDVKIMEPIKPGLDAALVILQIRCGQARKKRHVFQE